VNCFAFIKMAFFSSKDVNFFAFIKMAFYLFFGFFFFLGMLFLMDILVFWLCLFFLGGGGGNCWALISNMLQQRCCQKNFFFSSDKWRMGPKNLFQCFSLFVNSMTTDADSIFKNLCRERGRRYDQRCDAQSKARVSE
jgi:hypothetical protein